MVVWVQLEGVRLVRQPVGCGLHRDPGHLAVQVGPLLPRRHPGVDGHATESLCWLVHQDRPRRELMGRDRQDPGAEPAGRTLAAHPVLPRPLHHDEGVAVVIERDRITNSAEQLTTPLTDLEATDSAEPETRRDPGG